MSEKISLDSSDVSIKITLTSSIKFSDESDRFYSYSSDKLSFTKIVTFGRS